MAKDIAFKPTPFNRDEDIFVEESGRETLTFPLTDEEILKFAKHTSQLDEQYKAVDSKFQQAKKDFKGQLDGLNAQMNYNFMVIKDECQDREADCTVRYNFTKKVVQYVFAGEVMKERPMTDWDMNKNPALQKTLNGGSVSPV